MASAERLDVADRFTFVDGDFFEKVPTPGLPPLMDLNMMALSTGRARKWHQWHAE